MTVPAKNLNKPQFELSPIKAIELAAAKTPGSISLAQGIPSFPTPQIIKDFVCEKIQQHKCDKYSLTTGLPVLREEISLSLAADGLKYDPESEIIITVGSIEGITASILALTNPGDEVILPSPSYASYTGAIMLAGCVPRYAPLDEDQNFDFSIEQIEKNITRKTSAILYCSPNNPSGTVFSEKNTRAIMKLAEKHNLAVIIDEVYKDFYYSGETHFSAASVEGTRQRLIRVCSFSKAFSMTGWRVGFLHADKTLCERILKYHDAMVTCAPVASQYAALAALRYGEPYLKEFIAEFKDRRDYTIQKLDEMSTWLDYQLPSAAYFVFPRVKSTVPLSHNSEALAYDILEKVKVAVVPGEAFGPSGQSHLRITYGRDKEVLEQGLQRLYDYFSSGKSFSSAKVTSIKSPAETMTSLRRRLTQWILGSLASKYIKRNNTKIIGIAGSRGKTVFKRTVEKELSSHKQVRAGILSYNTRIGLPLSILNISIDRSSLGTLKTIYSAFKTAFFDTEQAEYLVLEYGFSGPSEARDLLKIVKPDCLIVTDFEAYDPNLDHSGLLKGIEEMLSKVPKDKVLWCSEGDLSANFSKDLIAENAFDSSSADLDPTRHDLVGTSAQRAYRASKMLLKLVN